MKKKQKKENKTRIHYITLFIVILIAITYRISLIPQSELNQHASMFYQHAENAINSHSLPLFGHMSQLGVSYGPYISYWVLLFYLIWKNPLTIFLLISTMSIITTLLIYLIGKTISGERTGLIAATLYIFSYITFYLDANTFHFFSGMAAPAIALLIYSICIIKLEGKQNYWIGAVVSAAILLQIGIGYFFSPALLILAINNKTRHAWRQILVGVILALFLFTPWIVFQYRTDFHQISTIGVQYQNAQTAKASQHWITEDILKKPIYQEFAPFAIISAILLFWLYLYKKQGNAMKIILATIVLNILWLLPFPYISTYYFQHIFICIFLVIAIALNEMLRMVNFQKKKRAFGRKIEATTILLVSAILVYAFLNMYFVKEKLDNSNIAPVGLEINVVNAIRTLLGDVKLNSGPDSVNKILYFGDGGLGFYTNKMLTGTGNIDLNRSVLILTNRQNLTITNNDTKSFRVNGRQVIIFDNKIKKIKFAMKYSEGWQDIDFNDSGWHEEKNPIASEKIIISNNENRTSIFIRCYIDQAQKDENRSLIIKISHSENQLEEIYFNANPQGTYYSQAGSYTYVMPENYENNEILAVKIDGKYLTAPFQIYFFQI